MEELQPTTGGSAKGGVLLKGTDHEKRVSVKLATNDDDHTNKEGEVGVELVEGPVTTKEHDNNDNNKKKEEAADNDYDDDDDDDTKRGGIGPRGRWRKKLCECTQVIACTPLCCMSFCCNIVLLSQLMTRLGLDWCGIPNATTAAGTFAMVILIYFSFWASYIMVFGIIFFPCMLFWMWAIYTRTRYQTRQYFQIPSTTACGNCADGIVEDCLITTFCTCCSTIQMARHTHDENRYPYQITLPMGLPPDAPPLYEDLSHERFQL